SFFLASSFSNLITLISGVAVRLLAGWNADLTDTNNWICKIRVFVLFTSRTAASWLITFATIDRWLSSSIDVHYRQMSTLKNARRGMIFVVLFSICTYAQLLYCYQANLVNAPLKCYSKTMVCRLVYDFEFIVITVFLPTLLMTVFGLMTVFNIHQSKRRRIQPYSAMVRTNYLASTREEVQRWGKKDRSLLLMLFIQIILLTIFSLPQATQSLYANIVRAQTQSAIANAINNFVLNIFFLLTYVTNGMPFYIYTLTGGSLFRKALFTSLRELCPKFT
ncbi:unnamed protein product, partial [Adineta ricciae]